MLVLSEQCSRLLCCPHPAAHPHHHPTPASCTGLPPAAGSPEPLTHAHTDRTNARRSSTAATGSQGHGCATHMHTCKHTGTVQWTWAHRYTLIHTCTCAQLWAHRKAHMPMDTGTHTQTCTPMDMDTETHSGHGYICAYACKDIDTSTHSYTHAQACRHTDMYMQRQSCTWTQRHMHTHAKT